MDLDQKVRSTRTVRLRYYRRAFPSLTEFSLAALARWVAAKLASGDLVLLDEVTIDIDGKWENYRFPRPRL